MPNRAAIVVDRGWIFAGDVEEYSSAGVNRVRLSDAVWIFRWEKIGFNGVIDRPEMADIRPIADLDIPVTSEIFRVPVHDEWAKNVVTEQLDPALPRNNNRAIVVADRGWIFAGDVDEETRPGRIMLSKGRWVFRWEKIGFNGVIATPEKADIRPMADMDIPQAAEIFRVPVPDNWAVAKKTK